MKRWIVSLLGLSLLVSGCARLKGLGTDSPPAAPTPASASTEPVPAPADEAQSEPAPKSTPDLASMTFVEKNDLYIRLLTEKQAAGIDTSQAEEAYMNSLEASLNGESGQADQYLQEAITLLLNQ